MKKQCCSVWRRAIKVLRPMCAGATRAILLLLVAMLAYAWLRRETSPLPQAGEG